MFCKQCGYRLWNLPSRICPECGTGFVPSEFEFTANSVQFCCPHCQACYYGTGEKGHLAPIEFTCTGCQKPIHMDQMILLPTAGVEEERTQVGRVPWLERGERGFFSGWFATIGMALVRPGQLVRAVPETSPAGSAWWFAVVTSTTCVLLGMGVIVIPSMIIGMAVGGGAGGAVGLAGTLLAVVLPLVISVAGVVGVTVVGIAMWGLVTQGLLRMTGTTHGSLRKTFDALCYSTGANVGTAIPCVGFYIGWIWWLVSAVVMIKESQRVRGWRAALSVLAFPLGSMATGIGLYVWFFVTMFSGIGLGVGAMSETSAVAGAMLSYAEEFPEAKLNHAIELVAADYLETIDLVAMNSMTTDEDVPIGKITLEQFDLLVVPQKSEAVKAAVATIPPDAVAHRCGDFVFVHHGIDLNACDPRLWIVVWSPDPDSGFNLRSKTSVAIGLCDGTVAESGMDELPAMLAKQNAIRAELNLPPLPDPRTVLHKRK